MRRRAGRTTAALVVVAGAMAGSSAATARAGGIIDLGLADEFTISQPVVQVEVGELGPLFLNEYLLDTGASGILAGANASAELRSLGFQEVATYVDFGVAGPQATQVSAAYDFNFAGSDGVPLTLPGVRMQTSGGDFAFYSGIAGMPLMAGRTVGLDLAAQADMVALRIGVAFDIPYAVTPAAHQYSVPLTMYEFPATGQQHPTDPLPANAALPFAPVQLQYGGTRVAGSFLLDTGAQQCILSRTMAFDLGLDVNGNGDLDDEAISFQTVAGVGGTIEIPVLRIDALTLKATNDVDILFRDVVVGIVDIDAAVPGVLGMNILNSGWELHALNTFLGEDPGPPGVFDRVDLDFRGGALRGEMRLSVDPGRDAFISQGPVAFTLASGIQSQAEAGHVAIGGSGSVTKSGGGTIVLDNVNTVTGTTFVQEGTLRIDVANALFGSPTVVQSGATLAVADGVVARLPSLMLAGGTLAARALAVNGMSGIARLEIGAGSVVSGGTGGPALSVGVAGQVSLAGESGGSLDVSSLVVDEIAGGSIDLGRGSLRIAAGGITRADLLADLEAGRDGGTWAGAAGIASSVVASDLVAGLPRAVGWLDQGDGSLFVAYAAPGDSNLDGLVDILDAANLVAGGRFNTGAGAVWLDGDFNYDGAFDVLDSAEFLTASLFNQGSYLGSAGLATGGRAALAVDDDSLTAVPEPASASLLAAMGLVAAIGAGFRRW
jgi:autotransporter-associated beta strand protein